MSIRIGCIKKAGGAHEDPHEAISVLGWTNEQDGSTGRSSRDEMYVWIKNEGGEAYVVSGQNRVRVITAVSSRGTKYVKTVADGTRTDNLLRLPECA